MNHTTKKKEGKITTLQISIIAVFMALTCLATMVIQIPIPLGYSHLGDSIIMIAALFFGMRIGVISGSIGSALADIITGYTQWAIPTLIIKGIVAFIVAKIARNKEGKFTVLSFQTVIATVLGMLFMTFGYVVSGAIFAGSLGAGLASAPGLLLKGALNIVVFILLGISLQKAKIAKILDL